MKFIDIQQQYQRYRSDIDARMHQVLEAAQFIMGPEVQELEECWQIMSVCVTASPPAVGP